MLTVQNIVLTLCVKVPEGHILKRTAEGAAGGCEEPPTRKESSHLCDSEGPQLIAKEFKFHLGTKNQRLPSCLACPVGDKAPEATASSCALHLHFAGEHPPVTFSEKEGVEVNFLNTPGI